MNNNLSIRRWSELRNLAVVALDTTIKIGTVDDFYFDPNTNAVRALRVKAPLLGYRALAVDFINEIKKDVITTDSAVMVIEEDHDRRLSQLPLGHSLLSCKVIGENGRVVGTVGNLLLATNPPITLRVAAFELAGSLCGRAAFTADQVVGYEDDSIIILNQVARRLS